MRWLSLLLLALGATAFAAGHASMQCYFQTSLKNASYQAKAFERIQRGWKQPKQVPALGKKTVVRSVIAKDGKLVSATVSMESGSKAWDEAAVAAVKKAAPFPPLPSDFAYDSVEADLHVSWER